LSSMSVSRVGRSWLTIEDAGKFFDATVVLVRDQPIKAPVVKALGPIRATATSRLGLHLSQFQAAATAARHMFSTASSGAEWRRPLVACNSRIDGAGSSARSLGLGGEAVRGVKHTCRA
jgi:hypothetical protein